MKIKILGNGGCLNEGLPYNAFKINDDFLVELPPDIMCSTQKLKISIGDINKLFISHLHGDHTFGLPFFVINKWMQTIQNKSEEDFIIYGPEDIDSHVFQLIEMAFSNKHPCFQWAKENIKTVIINENSRLHYNNFDINFFELEHIKFTYGFKINHNNKNLFSYIPDTKWCQNVEKILEEHPKAVLIDMNGGNPNVHISRNEIIEKGLNITRGKTIFYGTHLYEQFESNNDLIKCAYQDLEIKI